MSNEHQPRVGFGVMRNIRTGKFFVRYFAGVAGGEVRFIVFVDHFYDASSDAVAACALIEAEDAVLGSSHDGFPSHKTTTITIARRPSI